MKRLLFVAVVGALTASYTGCQGRRFWQNENAATPAASVSASQWTPSAAAPSGGCGPGCTSCGAPKAASFDVGVPGYTPVVGQQTAGR